MTEPVPLNPKLRNMLTRFIHTGKELPKYYPGCWTSHKYFEEDKLICVDLAFIDNRNEFEVVEIILKAGKDGWYTRFDTIAFALAKCVKLGSDKVKQAAYKAALEVCRTPEQLMTFNRYARNLKIGNGQGWRRMVTQWYNERDPMTLAKDVTRVCSRHGRSHNTIIRKAHYKVLEGDHARDAVIKYTIHGLKYAKNLMPGDMEGVKAIFDYIQKVEDMRHCEDPAAAATMAAQLQFTIDHVPGHLLTSQEVWNAILPQFSIEDLLCNIQRIHNMGFLTSESTTTAILVSLLTNKDIVKKSKITPLAIYITLCNYKKNSKPMKFEKAKVANEKEARRRARQVFNAQTGAWEWTVSKRHPKEVKHWGIDQPANPAVLAALNKMMDHSWLLTPPTNKRYMITMDMRHHMFKGRQFCKASFSLPKKGKKQAAKIEATPTTGGGDADTEKKSKKHLFAECFFNKNVTPGHAALILALHILKREKQVKLAVFTEEGVEVVSIERNFTSLEEAEFQLRKANLGRVQLDAPIEWAAKNNQKIDVFINMIDRPSRYMELDKSARGGRGPGGRFGPPPNPAKELVDHCPVRALERYRKSAKVPQAKLVIMSLASQRVGSTDGNHEGVLDIIGIDEHVPKVLDAFTLGQFK